MPSVLIYNNEFIIADGVLSHGWGIDTHCSAIDLVTQYGMFFPIGEYSAIALRAMLRAPTNPESDTSSSPLSTFMPRAGTYTGILESGSGLELVYMKCNAKEASIGVSPLPIACSEWNVFNAGSTHHDRALEVAIVNCKKPEQVIKKLNTILPESITFPIIIDRKKSKQAHIEALLDGKEFVLQTSHYKF